MLVKFEFSKVSLLVFNHKVVNIRISINLQQISTNKVHKYINFLRYEKLSFQKKTNSINLSKR